MPNHPTRGRPPVVSRDTLQDAAFELFLEQGYAGTTVSDIAQRAGVSRNTFFNHFAAKSDVFWVELDDAGEQLRENLTAPPPSGATSDPFAAVRAAVLSAAEAFGAGRVPFALTQYELIGSRDDLQASVMSRIARYADLIAGFLRRQSLTPLVARAAANAIVGAAAAAVQAWAASGTSRGDLAPYLRSAVDPVTAGFSTAS